MEEVAMGIADMQDLNMPTQPSSGSPIEQEIMALMLQNKEERMKGPQANKEVKSYFQRAKELLFYSAQPDRVIQRIWDDDLTLGVCAKPLKAGDVAWKCEDCEKDPTCIICLDCFNNSDHEGHRTWLKTNVSGCCDCGDPEGWEMDGACSKHKGIDSSKDVALSALPDQVRERAPGVAKALAKVLKQLLLTVLKRTDDDWQNNKEKRVAEQMISEFFDQSTVLLQSWKQCIFYLSEAYLEVFPGEFRIEASNCHECCYRYFPDDEFRQKYEEEDALFQSTLSALESVCYCTCTVVDLLFIADQRYNPLQKLSKKITQQCILLFQSYNFKQHLCFGYAASMPKFLCHKGSARGMAQLGVQILTMDSVTSRIFRDEKLAEIVTGTVKSFIGQLIEEEGIDQGTFYQCRFLRYDIKYIAKPNLMPQLVSETKMLEDLMAATAQFHFSDCQTNSTTMNEFGDATLQYLFLYASIDLEMSSVLESKYLSAVERNEDLARLMRYFGSKFESIEADHLSKFCDRGTFMMPLHRNFTYLLSRSLVKHYACTQLGAVEEFKAGESVDLPPTRFHEFLLEQGFFENEEQLQSIFERALFSGAKQMGFIAEIDANKWIYKGERFRLIAQMEHETYYEKYLRMIALFQVAICACAQKSRCIDILVNNFGTDDWLAVFFMSLSHPNGPSEEMFQGLRNFAVEKLANQVQLLFLKLIEIAITEASFLLPAQKKLLNKDKDPKASRHLEQMLGAHLRREVMHVLFSQGANSTIEKIKKASHQNYLKSEQFTKAVIELSTSQTDASGKKQFRLNAKGKHEAMFDPYYIVKKRQESATQTAYDQFYKNNANCNNIVGDYLGHYKYQTAVNRECWQAMAQSDLLTEVVCKTVKECIQAWLQTREQAKNAAGATKLTNEQLFKQELFPIQTLHMGLKLLLIIVQNQSTASGENMETIKANLTAELLSKAFNLEACKDKKLSEIGMFIKGLIHKEDAQQTAQEEQKSLQTARSQAEADAKKKAMVNKKKAAMLAKMKKKQTSFMIPQSKPETAANPEGATTDSKANHPVEQSAFEDSQMDEQQEQNFGQTCASCQEPLDVERFFDRPFAQLCYLSQTKLLYYTCQQTVESQRKSLKNLRDAQDFTSLPEQVRGPEEEEEKKEASVGQMSHRDSQSEVSGAAGHGLCLVEDPHIEWDKLVMQDLQLASVIDEQYKTGVSFMKCCHAFHLDCLQQYQTADGEMNYQRRYMKQMVGQDDGCIQCPMCKTFKNTWQPFLPLGLDRSKESNDRNLRDLGRLSPYVDFCSQLIINQLNAAHSWNDAGDRAIPRSILAVDIKNDPENFVLRMCQVVSQLVIEGTLMNNQRLLTPFDAKTQQNGVVLREVVYILLTVRELIQRVFENEEADAKTRELAEFMLTKLSSDVYVENALKKNLQVLVIRFLFISAVLMPIEYLKNAKTAIVHSLFATMKAQVVVADTFRKGYGRLTRGHTQEKVQETLSQAETESQSEAFVESQLAFLRAATSMTLCTDALIKCQESSLTNFSSSEAMQLNLNQEVVDSLRAQVDDQAEFNLLVNFLGVSSAISPASVMDRPASLAAFESADDFSSILYWSIFNLSGLSKNFHDTIEDFVKSAPSADLPLLHEQIDTEMSSSDDFIGMPENLHLLTTYFSFNLVELPGDFHRLVKQYYTRQCRVCRKQLQESAICLLCGDIVCHDLPKSDKTPRCCSDRPGMKRLVERRNSSPFYMQDVAATEMEGEMCYHARHCEGGNAIFLVPQTATIYMIDQGRILRGESPYRNELGETFSQKSAKWDNYLLNDDTGGAQVMASLRKNYIEHKVPQTILQGRQSNERVILRHVY